MNEIRLEQLAETIYEEIVSANFLDLSTNEEQLIYQIAQKRALESF
tara:strand:- start:363 stop:500 length:138 start_codon:yes stop_codon:yes gene_type:complete